MRVIVSYRRDDVPDAAARLTEALRERLGGTDSGVFLDIDWIVVEGSSYLLRPLHMSGVVFVDFDDDEALQRAVRGVGAETIGDRQPRAPADVAEANPDARRQRTRCAARG
jgi:hypothetical protein